MANWSTRRQFEITAELIARGPHLSPSAHSLLRVVSVCWSWCVFGPICWVSTEMSAAGSTLQHWLQHQDGVNCKQSLAVFVINHWETDTDSHRRAAGLPPALGVAAGVAPHGLLLPPPLHSPHRGPRGPRGQPRSPLRLLRPAVSPGDEIMIHDDNDDDDNDNDDDP